MAHAAHHTNYHLFTPCAAFAIGYDWMYNVMNTSSRAYIAKAMINLGLKPGLDIYKSNNSKYNWWAVSPINWNIVCNGGLTMAALAVGNDTNNLTLVNQILDFSRYGLGLGFATYGPEGAWVEGPAYWVSEVWNILCFLGQNSLCVLFDDDDDDDDDDDSCDAVIDILLLRLLLLLLLLLSFFFLLLLFSSSSSPPLSLFKPGLIESMAVTTHRRLINLPPHATNNAGIRHSICGRNDCIARKCNRG